MKPFLFRRLLSVVLASTTLAGCASDASSSRTSAAKSPARTSAAKTASSTQPAPAAAAMKGGGDAEIFAQLLAVDTNEVNAATTAQGKQLSQPAMEYARMLHEQHAEHMEQTRELARQVGITPAYTEVVKRELEKGAEQLARLAPLDGPAFERGYIQAMADAHAEVLKKIDQMLVPAARNEQLRQHLATTRGHIEAHLKQAMALQQAGQAAAGS